MNEFLEGLTPGAMLKWGGVVFAYCVAVLIIVAIVLAMFRAF